ncbi:MAG: tautomerase family protein [Clostridia bacterium]|nr:tautomerase family protein [Clostridia bacterium]
MPYIQIKAYPKDENIKKKVAQKIEEVFLEEWGCKKEAISVSFEEIDPANWENTVVRPLIVPNKDKMYILNGENNK